MTETRQKILPSYEQIRGENVALRSSEREKNRRIADLQLENRRLRTALSVAQETLRRERHS